MSKYVEKLGIQVSEDVQRVIDLHVGTPRRGWDAFMGERLNVSRQGLDLLDRLLTYDHEERITARDALNHDFFKLYYYSTGMAADFLKNVPHQESATLNCGFHALHLASRSGEVA